MSVNGPLFTFSSQTNIQLQKAPSNDVQHLQEELIAVKLREAEANLSLKEMKHKVYDLEGQWEVTQQLQTLQPIGNPWIFPYSISSPYMLYKTQFFNCPGI